MTAGNAPTIAVVVPAYLAADRIQTVLSEMPPLVRHIVVVDDASSDATSAMVERLRDERIHLVRHDVNKGVGAAMLTGYDAALALGAEIVVKMDSDGQMDPRYLPALIRPIVLNVADYTKGNRFLHGRELRAMPGRRRVGNTGLSFLVKLASGYWPIFDPANGYTAIHSAVLRAVDRGSIAPRFFFETSLLLELSRLRAVVADVYIPARYRDEPSHLSARRAAVGFLGPLIAGAWRRLIRQYFVQDFTSVSLFVASGTVLVVFGLIWGLWHWGISNRDGVPATTGTVMLAVLPLVIGFQLLLQAITQDIANVPRDPIHGSLLEVERDAVADGAGARG
jgi:glycosyltransferase involved in cell wall biosynthesis